MAMPQTSPARKYACSVALSEEVAPGAVRMRLACPELAASIEPGQFFNLHVPGDASEILRLPFSWSNKSVEEGWVEFVFLVVGRGTQRLAALPVGTPTTLLGPAGHGWQVPQGAKRALLVAGGSGVVPLLPQARALVAAGVQVDFVEGAPYAARVLYEGEIVAAGAAFHLSTDDGSRGYAGFATGPAAELLAANAYDVVCTCGPEPMMRAVAKLAAEAGVPCQVSMERLMGCGFGACTTCLVDTVDGRKGACKDGPVFDAERIVW
jgi:dihydroorotate dehydrogenase electron transfer subunit